MGYCPLTTPPTANNHLPGHRPRFLLTSTAKIGLLHLEKRSEAFGDENNVRKQTTRRHGSTPTAEARMRCCCSKIVKSGPEIDLQLKH